MSNEFRELLKKIGSGTHTSKNLSRQETAIAIKMMIQEEATPAQIGAFLIAHRIKRPTPAELAGILDAYDQLSNKLSATAHNFPKTPVVFGYPYDGRSRTVPVSPLTMLILAIAEVPLILHGSDCLPTKYGIPLVQIWQDLGIDFTKFSLPEAQGFLQKTGFGFFYVPKHFPLAHKLTPYREQIGKRPTLSTAELVWSPLQEDTLQISGFVHPPTEERFAETFKLRKTENYTTVKGLEGSCDLSCNRTAIVGVSRRGQEFTRLLINPHDYDLNGHDLTLESPTQLNQELIKVLEGKNSAITSAAIFNGGFYLWHLGVCSSIESGFALAEEMIVKLQLRDKLNYLQKAALSFSS